MMFKMDRGWLTLGVMMLSLSAFLLAGCFELSEKEIEYDHYKKERALVKICPDGTKIFQWHDKLWVRGPQIPDQEVASPLDKVC